MAYNVLGDGAHDYLIKNFRYEGLPLMNPGTKIKVYPNKHGNLSPDLIGNLDLTGLLAEVVHQNDEYQGGSTKTNGMLSAKQKGMLCARQVWIQRPRLQ